MRVGGGLIVTPGRGGGGGGGGGGGDPTPGGRLYAQDIGDGVNVEYIVQHSFGTKDVIVNVYSNDDDDDVDAEIYHDTANEIRVVFAIPPDNNEFRCVVLSGFGGDGGGGGGDVDLSDVEITGGTAIGLTNLESTVGQIDTLSSTDAIIETLDISGQIDADGTYASGDMSGGLAHLSHLYVGGTYTVTEDAGQFIPPDNMTRNAVGTGIIVCNNITIDAPGGVGGLSPFTSQIIGPRAGGINLESTYKSHYFSRQIKGIALQDFHTSLTMPPIRTVFVAANGTKCTAVTESDHGFHVGEVIQMMNHNDNRFNGQFVVTDVDDSVTFKFALAVNGAPTASGFVGVPMALDKGIGLAMCTKVWAYGADVEPRDFGSEHAWASSIEDNTAVWALEGGNYDSGRHGVTQWGNYSYPYMVVAAARATMESISRSGDTVTVQTSAPHGMAAGMPVYINHCINEDFKGRWFCTGGGGWITGASRGSGNAVYTTDRPHGIQVGDVITVSGMSSTDYSGSPTVFNQSNMTVTAVTSTTVTISLAGGSATATSTTNARSIISADRMTITTLRQYRYAWITSYAGTGGDCTFTTDIPHAFEVGDTVELDKIDEHNWYGNRNEDLNQLEATITDVDTRSFTIALAGSPDPTGVAISSKHWGIAYVARDLSSLSGLATSVANLSLNVGEIANGRAFTKRRVAWLTVDTHGGQGWGGDIEEEVYYYAPATYFGNAKRKIGIWNGVGEVREPSLTAFNPQNDGPTLPVNTRYLLVNNTSGTADVNFDIDNAHDGQIVQLHVTGFPIRFTDGDTVDLKGQGDPETIVYRQGAIVEFICYGGVFRPCFPNTHRAQGFEARIVSGGADGSFKSFSNVATDTQPLAMLGSVFGLGGILAGPGGSTATDASFLRSAAATWRSDSKVQVTTGTTMSELREDGYKYYADDADTQPIVQLGTVLTLPGILMGPGGSSAPDANLLRLGTDRIQVGNTLVFPERTTNPSDPAAGSMVQVYMKADKLVFAYKTAGNVMHYFTLDVTATSTQSLVYSASAP